MCISTVHSAEAGESSQSDSCQPSVLSGDSRHCYDVESEVSDASSDSIPEECPNQAQQPTSLPVPSEGSSASPLDIGVLIKSGTLRSLDKSMKLKLIKQAPDAKFNYPTKFMHGCNRRFKPEWTQSHSRLHYSPSEDGVYCKACVPRHWGHTHNIKADEVQGFVADLKQLFHKSSKEAYETEMQQLSVSWSNPVFQYYMKNIHPEMYTSIGRWVLETEGVYSPFSGVVSNQSESFNMVLKSLQQWKEVPVDCILLSFYLMQSFFMNEITRGLEGQGQKNSADGAPITFSLLFTR